jgi:hypothetical protein
VGGVRRKMAAGDVVRIHRGCRIRCF